MIHTTIDQVVDAAHKHGRDWRLGHNKREDGNLMRKNLHTLYDNDLLVIGNDGILELKPEVLMHYQEFSGEKSHTNSGRKCID